MQTIFNLPLKIRPRRFMMTAGKREDQFVRIELADVTDSLLCSTYSCKKSIVIDCSDGGSDGGSKDFVGVTARIFRFGLPFPPSSKRKD